ncbi:MAG: phosphoribosylamine--glycine ligase [Candidatus Diapherotrites archaeon]
MTVKILLIGKTARADCIAEAIKKSAQKVELYSYMDAKNPGVIKKSAKFKFGDTLDFENVKKFASENKVDFAFLGPDDPIAIGAADELERIGIPSIGPKKELAKLESSKSFARELIIKYKIPGNPKFKIFENIEGIKEFIESLNGFVIKPDGLTGGKGVKVQDDHLKDVNDAIKYCKEVLGKHPRVIVEEKLEGEEFSLQSLTDGVNVVDCVVAQDHKRAYENDTGPNCGGMGSYSCENHLLPFLKKKDLQTAHEISVKVAKALLEETGEKYKGVLYGGFILTKDGVKIIEYNSRFGDPEVMNCLPILESDFVDACYGVIENNLKQKHLEFAKKATVCKYVVPKGYPENPVRSAVVDISKIESKRVNVYYGAVNEENGKLLMTGSRAISIVGIGNTLSDAEQKAQHAIETVKGEIFYRKDIGTAKLIEKRVQHMKQILGK